MKKSLAKNSFFYMFYNVLNMVFPFLTSMYVARVLTSASIGEVAYANNIVTYFSILAFLGIPTYGLREIAKARNNQEELSRVYSELFVINGISTIVFSLAYYVTILVIPRFHENLVLHLIVGLTVILNMLNNSWLYDGLEEFKFVAIRNAIFKVVMFGVLVIWVRTTDDVLPYAFISILGTAGNNIINVAYARKYVQFRCKDLNLKRHMKPIMMLVIVNLAIEIYTLVDTTMLGAFSTKEQVAFYSYASKINKILLQITNTFTMTIVPRLSFYRKENMIEEYNDLLTKGLKIILLVAIPLVIGVQFTANFIITKLYGDTFILSAAIEKMLSFVVLISPIGYLLGSRVLLVNSGESKMVIAVSAGAVTNIILNWFLIQKYDTLGAAVSSVIGEVVVMTMYLYIGNGFYKLSQWKKSALCYAGGGYS